MSPRSRRLLETALVSAFVSVGMSAVMLVGMASPPTPDALDPLLRVAIEADAELAAMDELDELAAYRVSSLYEAYLQQREQREAVGEVEWARTRVARLHQLEADLEEMRKLEAEAKKLEEGP